MKKRHWCLGTALVLLGSWITHTSTATVYDDLMIERSQDIVDSKLGFMSDYSIDEALLANDFKSTLPSSSSASINPISSAFIDNQAAESSPSNSNSNSNNNTNGVSKRYEVVKGDTLGTIFEKVGYGYSLSQLINQHPQAKKLARLDVGAELIFQEDQNQMLSQINYPINSLQDFVITLKDRQVTSAEIIDLPVVNVERSISGEISSSLYHAALEAGLSNKLVMEMVEIFEWDIDFIQDIRKGDRFHVVYEEIHLEEAKLADGPIVAAEFTTQDKTYRAIRFTPPGEKASYYTPEGESMMGMFLRSPVKFNRISSRFGKRKHPILKRWKTHKGVDYAANRGTPIRATAHGKVSHAGRKGGYGNTIVLEHAERYSTLYAHMSKFAKNIQKGSRVSQGDIIGYVGSSGLATGPHLHYEFRVAGVHRNPLTVAPTKASSISKALLPAFSQTVNTQLAKLDTLSTNYQLANNGATANSGH